MIKAGRLRAITLGAATVLLVLSVICLPLKGLRIVHEAKF